MKESKSLQESAMELIDELNLSYGAGHMAIAIADLQDTFLWLFSESNVTGRDVDHAICTLGILYRHAKAIDAAALDESSK